jgi:hypothetical protein
MEGEKHHLTDSPAVPLASSRTNGGKEHRTAAGAATYTTSTTNIRAQFSRLLSLPPDMKDMVWSYIFAASQVVIIDYQPPLHLEQLCGVEIREERFPKVLHIFQVT